MLPLDKRKEMVRSHPRVRFHKEDTPCTALTSARSSVSTYYHPDPEIRKAKQEKARCRNKAHWVFRALKSSWANDGDYCWIHLIHRGLMGDMGEEEAFRRWYERKYGGQE